MNAANGHGRGPDRAHHTARHAPSRRHAGPGRFLSAVDRLERYPGADDLIDSIRGRIHRLPLGRVRDLLHGRPIGHPAHPLLVQMPIGAWFSAGVLDLLPGEGRRRAARTLVGVGTVAAAPAAWAGWADWAELHRQQMRVGLVHAAGNVAAVGLYAASWATRRAGRHTAGRVLGWTGFTLVGITGALGGHMAYRQASGANHAEEVPHLVSPGWHAIAVLDDLPVGEPVRRHVDDVPVVVVRGGDGPDDTDGTVHVLAERCSHLAGPLSEGTLEDGCVRCPWHGSLFRLSDGWNVEGPATAPQPAFDTRVVDGRLEVRLRHLAGAEGSARESEPTGAPGVADTADIPGERKRRHGGESGGKAA
ncbi:Rieske 2Fe-2S domain-containing protein [Streptomyces alkaliphilus]|uniref:Rieske 2Fe-2S domain-containing protein n=1 Tax=Streptomyces alkaliphilus TaxID=1472722 RepID=A0A7W3TBU2_9ACTN|nr:Rieske 2Fe-2S domain-containing protein [Streptomyces alkaliphilus]MBB0243893.1 Rieske 2Fe-2S domain-containing protein [Streptomyces alkaliphilus]